MRLVLVRHGETEWNREYRVQGQADLPLNQSGRVQAEAIAGALRGEPIEAVYTSPLSRARETARAIGDRHQVDITIDGGLKELNVGLVDGKYYPEMRTDYPDFFRVWADDPALARWPGGETLLELQDRVWATLQSIIDRNYVRSVVIVSHLFVLLAVLCRALDLSLTDFRRLNISVASISILEFSEGRFRLDLFNETCHLK